jgi:hypothetical protein
MMWNLLQCSGYNRAMLLKFCNLLLHMQRRENPLCLVTIGEISKRYVHVLQQDTVYNKLHEDFC